MGYAVVHMMKIKSGALGGIQSHNNREHEPKTNPDVDMELSDENYHLVPCDNYKRVVKEKMSDLVESGRAVRKDAVVVCNFIVTSDFDSMDALGDDGQRAFFEDSVKWFSNRYGADRVLNAVVHMDETTPHMHIGVMPITQDGRLSAKAIFTKTELKAIQTEFARDVGAKYGLERGVEGSERTHLSEARFKEEKAIQMANEHGAIANILSIQAEESRQELAEATRSLETVKGEISTLQEQKDALQGEITALEERKNKMEQLAKRANAYVIKYGPEVQKLHDEKEELERTLPELQAKISDAKTVLATVKEAIKEGMDTGAKHIGNWDEAMAMVRERKKRDEYVKGLEARISLFERFISMPHIKSMWEDFQRLIGRDKSHKTDRDR